ncbi:hypothetical protein TVAG_161310 [Trichomonas vaginalis G3]|uniref:Transmembrane protein n=1 Tax=Trichomonas vaginalis (strain ATCC PRA-98 / G3) TaxID=412133 RepID=A2E4Y6_TRIV3|nr:hypothetical protein TVAGG3_0228630 [Trichomonas vaginalis G3]EAY12325.1 hypothetical protein TVAG_161310 [Trichomonas vaginalis G3]KAI5552453.1 hypothetical protein TVAGG3_0228630 [Trichomonas vaginalis G3]|eukprot:XP_001324548.1 hypothetical protein [Trichomonas vaginalis G3]
MFLLLLLGLAFSEDALLSKERRPVVEESNQKSKERNNDQMKENNEKITTKSNKKPELQQPKQLYSATDKKLNDFSNKYIQEKNEQKSSNEMNYKNEKQNQMSHELPNENDKKDNIEYFDDEWKIDEDGFSVTVNEGKSEQFDKSQSLAKKNKHKYEDPKRKGLDLGTLFSDKKKEAGISKEDLAINPYGDPNLPNQNYKPEDYEEFERKNEKDKTITPYDKRRQDKYMSSSKSDTTDEYQDDEDLIEEDGTSQGVLKDGDEVQDQIQEFDEFQDYNNFQYQELQNQPEEPEKQSGHRFKRVKRIKRRKNKKNKSSDQSQEIPQDAGQYQNLQYDQSQDQSFQNQNDHLIEDQEFQKKEEYAQIPKDENPYEPVFNRKFSRKKKNQNLFLQNGPITPLIVETQSYMLGFIRKKPLNVTYSPVPIEVTKPYCRINEAVVEAYISGPHSVQCRLSVPIFTTSAHVTISFDGNHFSSPVIVETNVPFWFILFPIAAIAGLIYISLKPKTKKKKILNGPNLDSFRPMTSMPKKEETFGADIDNENIIQQDVYYEAIPDENNSTTKLQEMPR